MHGETAEYRKFLLEGGYDVIMCYAAQNWATDLVFEAVDGIKAKKVLVPCGYSGLRLPIYKEYFRTLPANLAKFDALVYMSTNYQDVIFGRENGVSDREIYIPNGAGEEFLVPPTGFRERFNIRTKYLLLNVSNHTGMKGHDFVIDALRMMKRKDVTLAIIGESLGGMRRFWRGCMKSCLAKSLLDRRIRLFTSLPREWVVGAYAEADLFLFGSRVECAPLVMYESFASGTPFITTPVGNVADHSDVVRIVRTPREMADEAGHLLDDNVARTRVAESGRKLWQYDHNWNAISGRYEELYLSLLAGKGIPR